MTYRCPVAAFHKTIRGMLHVLHDVTINDDARMAVTSLGATADEAAQGVTIVTSLRFKGQMTVVVLEATDGLMVGGIYVGRNAVRSLSAARNGALERLIRLRDRRAHPPAAAE